MGRIFRKIFYYDGEISEKQYMISRIAFIIEAMCSQPITSLVGGAYIIGMFTYLGASEAFSGVVLSIVSLASVVQFFTPLLSEKLERKKLFATTCISTQKILKAGVLLLPMLIPNKLVALAVAVIIFVSIAFLNSFVTPMHSVWMMSLVPYNMRGKYFGMKDELVFLSSSVFVFIGGNILDSYTSIGEYELGFFMLGMFVMAFSLIDMSCYFFMSEPLLPSDMKTEKKRIDIKEVFSLPIKTKSFRPVIIIYVLYQFSFALSSAMFSVYQVSRLQLNYGFISITESVGIALRIFLAPVWGKIASCKGWYFSAKYSMLALVISWIMRSVLTAENAYYMLWILNIISAVAWAGIGLSVFGLQFELAPKENTSVYISFIGALSGIVAFLAGITGSSFISVLKGFSFNIASFTVCDMQMLFMISVFIGLICTIYISHLGRREKLKKT